MICKTKLSSLVWIGCGVLALGVAGCSQQGLGMYEPSEINARRLEIQDGKFGQVLPVSAADSVYLADLSENYLRYGVSDLDVSVLYDPDARKNGPLTARREADRLAGLLGAEGVKTVQAGTLPVAGQGETLRALFSYNTVTAHAPSGCGTIPGLDNTRANYRGMYEDKPYRLGCSVEAMIARQVERPADLAGRGGLKGPSDGRRQSQIMEIYRTGVPNEPFKDSESSSGSD
ncbi:MAG: hypothetical protein H6862_03990 [Rhodospirillales bacterium]|nr:hypothetical protein [Rhodospirillales bacterium]